MYPTSEATNELATALAKAQAEMTNASMNRVNPHFKSKFADLAAVRDATIPVLAKHGLSLVQFTTTHFDQNGVTIVLRTRLSHSSGQWMEGSYPIPSHPDKPQIMGSALTYARRYSWAAMCGIASEEDDDANAAQSADSKPMWGTRNGDIKQKSAYQARKDGDWEPLVKEIKEQSTPDQLKQWGIANADRIHQLPTNWQLHLSEAYEAHLIDLKNKFENA